VIFRQFYAPSPGHASYPVGSEQTGEALELDLDRGEEPLLLLSGGALVVDRRSPEAYAGSHIPGALNVGAGTSFPHRRRAGVAWLREPKQQLRR
jgi:hypothetical protein